ncbi:hypothetical protein BRADI_3g07252v3 [Brachypodium distachyon]|uniref:Uncharacterized protein n=1 Tax=Brachypodium distachyon TaxID=15368 RepID=A0A0Q3LN36_BRADI|nr:hypothetical protein BRADI_3g07252v3 [Brachypodium distachyon]
MNRSTANESASPKSAKTLSDLNHHQPIYFDLSTPKKFHRCKRNTRIEESGIETEKSFSVCNNMNRSTAKESASPKSAKILSDLNHHEQSQSNQRFPTKHAANN